VGAGVADEKGVAVGCGARHAQASRHAGGGADVLDHDRLSEQLGEALGLDARARVDAAARSERHHERERPRGPRLGRGDAGLYDQNSSE